MSPMSNRSPYGLTRPPSDLVLFVEDAPDIRSLHAIHLRQAGYRVAEATNGVEGVERAIQLQPGLILMDLAMPILDGFEATRRLKNHPRTSHIPVLVLTAYGYQGYLREAASCGCDGLLTKPASAAALVARVNEILRPRASGIMPALGRRRDGE